MPDALILARCVVFVLTRPGGLPAAAGELQPRAYTDFELQAAVVASLLRTPQLRPRPTFAGMPIAGPTAGAGIAANAGTVGESPCRHCWYSVCEKNA